MPSLALLAHDSYFQRMLGHLAIIDDKLAQQVREGLGVKGNVDKITPARQPIDLKESPALRLYGKYEDTLAGRKVGILLGAGFDVQLKDALVSAITKQKAKAAIVTSKIEGEVDASGAVTPADMFLRAAPSVVFDAVVVIAGPDGDKALAANHGAVSFLMDANRHCKAVGWGGIPMLVKKAGLEAGPGLIDLGSKSKVKDFVDAAKAGRFWERESE